MPKAIKWAPDGDEAFDDGSIVLHIDVANRVRLIGYRLVRCEEDYPHDPAIPSAYEGEFHRYHHDPATLNDVWLEADKFYRILQGWRDSYEAEWKAAPKLFKAHGPDEHKDQHLAEFIRFAASSKSLQQSRGGASN